MNKKIYKKHVKNLRTAVQNYLNEYTATKEAAEKAKAVYDATAADGEAFIRRNGNASLEIARVKALTETRRIEMEQAKKNFREIRDNRFGLLNQAALIRQEMSDELSAAYIVDPAQVDSNTMTIINSGICKAADFTRLYDDAEKAGNVTMCRLIGQAAGNYAKTAEGNDRITANMIVNRAGNTAGNTEELDSYDGLVIALSHGTGTPDTGRNENPAMLQYFIDSTADSGD